MRKTPHSVSSSYAPRRDHRPMAAGGAARTVIVERPEEPRYWGNDQLTALDAGFLELEQADDGALMYIGAALEPERGDRRDPTDRDRSRRAPGGRRGKPRPGDLSR